MYRLRKLFKSIYQLFSSSKDQRKIPVLVVYLFFLISWLVTILWATSITPSSSYPPAMLFILFDPSVNFAHIPHFLRLGLSFSLSRPHVSCPQIPLVTHLGLCVTSPMSTLSVALYFFQLHLLSSGASSLSSPCPCIMSSLGLSAVQSLIFGLLWDVHTPSYYHFYSFSFPLGFMPTSSETEGRKKKSGGAECHFSHHCCVKHFETIELVG